MPCGKYNITVCTGESLQQLSTLSEHWTGAIANDIFTSANDNGKLKQGKAVFSFPPKTLLAFGCTRHSYPPSCSRVTGPALLCCPKGREDKPLLIRSVARANGKNTTSLVLDSIQGKPLERRILTKQMVSHSRTAVLALLKRPLENIPIQFEVQVAQAV